MIKALASYQFGPGASPGVDVILYLVTDPCLQSRIQLFRERLSEKNVHATIPKGNMGYDQYTVAVELSFVAFL